MGDALAARLYGLRGEARSTARFGVRAREDLLRAIALDPSLADADFGLGLYNYYADTLSAAARVFCASSWAFPAATSRKAYASSSMPLPKATLTSARGPLLSGDQLAQLRSAISAGAGDRRAARRKISVESAIPADLRAIYTPSWAALHQPPNTIAQLLLSRLVIPSAAPTSGSSRGCPWLQSARPLIMQATLHGPIERGSTAIR